MPLSAKKNSSAVVALEQVQDDQDLFGALVGVDAVRAPQALELVVRSEAVAAEPGSRPLLHPNPGGSCRGRCPGRSCRGPGARVGRGWCTCPKARSSTSTKKPQIVNPVPGDVVLRRLCLACRPRHVDVRPRSTRVPCHDAVTSRPAFSTHDGQVLGSATFLTIPVRARADPGWCRRGPPRRRRPG